MALRTIRVQGDSVLTKKSRTVDKMTPRIGELITDMLDTMYDAMGVGLAAPQVGILKRIVVIDVGEGPIVLINPEILETSGEQTGDEGCLSVPGMAGQVTRPNYVKVKALDVNMNEQIYEGEGLLARAFCHEIDHLTVVSLKYGYAVATAVQLLCCCQSGRTTSDDCDRLSCADRRDLRFYPSFCIGCLDDRFLILFCADRISVQVTGTCSFAKCWTHSGCKLRKAVCLV